MKKMITDYAINGAILHNDRSCKPYSLGQIDQREHMIKKLGVPALLLEADHNDPRIFAEKQVEDRIEIFMEMMEGGA